MSIAIAALSIIVPHWRQTKWSSTVGWIINYGMVISGILNKS